MRRPETRVTETAEDNGLYENLISLESLALATAIAERDTELDKINNSIYIDLDAQQNEERSDIATKAKYLYAALQNILKLDSPTKTDRVNSYINKPPLDHGYVDTFYNPLTQKYFTADPEKLDEADAIRAEARRIALLGKDYEFNNFQKEFEAAEQIAVENDVDIREVYKDDNLYTLMQRKIHSPIDYINRFVSLIKNLTIDSEIDLDLELIKTAGPKDILDELKKEKEKEEENEKKAEEDKVKIIKFEDVYRKSIIARELTRQKVLIWHEAFRQMFIYRFLTIYNKKQLEEQFKQEPELVKVLNPKKQLAGVVASLLEEQQPTA